MPLQFRSSSFIGGRETWVKYMYSGAVSGSGGVFAGRRLVGLTLSSGPWMSPMTTAKQITI